VAADDSQVADYPTADVWADDGKVSMVIVNASIIEYQGNLVPGLALSVSGAMKFAETILEKAREAMEGEDE
jgi:hypothetical protein